MQPGDVAAGAGHEPQPRGAARALGTGQSNVSGARLAGEWRGDRAVRQASGEVRDQGRGDANLLRPYVESGCGVAGGGADDRDRHVAVAVGGAIAAQILVQAACPSRHPNRTQAPGLLRGKHARGLEAAHKALRSDEEADDRSNLVLNLYHENAQSRQAALVEAESQAARSDDAHQVAMARQALVESEQPLLLPAQPRYAEVEARAGAYVAQIAHVVVETLHLGQ